MFQVWWRSCASLCDCFYERATCTLVTTCNNASRSWLYCQMIVLKIVPIMPWDLSTECLRFANTTWNVGERPLLIENRSTEYESNFRARHLHTFRRKPTCVTLAAYQLPSWLLRRTTQRPKPEVKYIKSVCTSECVKRVFQSNDWQTTQMILLPTLTIKHL